MKRPTRLSFIKPLSVNFSAIIFLLVILSSCGTTRPYTYMQGTFDTAALSKVNIPEPYIQKGDLISIIVYSDNPEATKIYNQSLINATSGSTGLNSSSSGNEGIQTVGGLSPTSQGYLVDENGNIQFQQLGLLHVEGLTRTDLKHLLDSKLKDTLLTNPYYTIRFLNSRFTLLGEIARPGIFTIPSDHINILEALGLAGDITYFGRRDNVLIIREHNGKREWGRIDLTKPEIMSSPYFYLQQNDIVIFEQTKKKSIVNDQVTTRNLGIATSLVSIAVIVYSILRQ